MLLLLLRSLNLFVLQYCRYRRCNHTMMNGLLRHTHAIMLGNSFFLIQFNCCSYCFPLSLIFSTRKFRGCNDDRMVYINIRQKTTTKKKPPDKREDNTRIGLYCIKSAREIILFPSASPPSISKILARWSNVEQMVEHHRSLKNFG